MNLQIFMVSSKGMLVNNEVRPIIAISKSEFTTSLQIKESYNVFIEH